MKHLLLAVSLFSTIACAGAPASGPAGSSAEQPTTEAVTHKVVQPVGIPEARIPFKLSGVLRGLAAKQIDLTVLGQTVSLSTNGRFEIEGSAAPGADLSVTIAAQPTAPWQTCVVQPSLEVICGTRSFLVRGTMQGLRGQLVLRRDDGAVVYTTVNGTYSFEQPIPSGSEYSVWIEKMPADQRCEIATTDGIVRGEDVVLPVTCAQR